MAMPADPHRSMMNVFRTYASSTPYHESPYSPVHRCGGFEASGKAQPVVCFQLFTWHTLFRNASQCNSDARSKPIFIHLILLLYDSPTSLHHLSPDLHLSLSHPPGLLHLESSSFASLPLQLSPTRGALPQSALPATSLISSNLLPIFTKLYRIILGSSPNVLLTACCVLALESKRRMK